MLDFIFLIGGIALIIFSANWLVNGASALAKKYGVSDLVIGLTIVAFGTSAPELTVNVFAALEGSTDIAIGNVLGSNIANILLIVGVSAVIFPLTIKRNTTWKEIPLSLLAAIVLGFLANDVVIDGADESLLSRIDGLVLICFFAIFMFYTADMAKNSPEILLDDEIVPKPIWKCLLLIVGGLLGLYFGGDFMVDAAVNIANRFGMSEKLIGVTIIALGTSVPELATSVVAAMKKYGLVLADNGSPWYFQGTQDTRWPTGLLDQLKSIPSSAFEAVDTAPLIVNPDSARARDRLEAMMNSRGAVARVSDAAGSPVSRAFSMAARRVGSSNMS